MTLGAAMTLGGVMMPDAVMMPGAVMTPQGWLSYSSSHAYRTALTRACQWVCQRMSNRGLTEDQRL